MNRTSLALCVSALVLCAGTCVPAAFAQAGSRPNGQNQNQNQPYRSNDQGRDKTGLDNERYATPLQFVSMNKLDGSTITNASKDEVGTVGDLIIERGRSGVEYVIVKSGAWLGMGGREVAVPYSAFGWDSQNNHPTLDMTKDQLRARPEFSQDRWSDNKDAKDRNDALRQEIDKAWGADPYANRLNGAKTTNINGTVTNVERRSSTSSTVGHAPDRGDLPNREDIVLVVRTDDGSKRVVLGPSWYVLGSENAPMRGDTVTISAYDLNQNGQTEYVARSVDTNGRTLTLRDTNGMSRWSDNSSDRYPHPKQRYVLFSELNGKSVECRGESCGNVDDAIIEINSGRVAFLSIDPDENFLGIADTDRLIPLNVVSMTTNDTINIDATKEMVLASQKTPDDIATLSRADVQSIYRAFDVNTPDFRPTSTRSEELSSAR